MVEYFQTFGTDIKFAVRCFGLLVVSSIFKPQGTCIFLLNVVLWMHYHLCFYFTKYGADGLISKV